MNLMRRRILWLNFRLWLHGSKEADHYLHVKYCQEYPCPMCRFHRHLAMLRHYESPIDMRWDHSAECEANQWQPRYFTSQLHRTWRLNAAPKGRLP